MLIDKRDTVWRPKFLQFLGEANSVETPITAAQYEELRAFDAALHVGQRVMIRWTQGHRF